MIDADGQTLGPKVEGEMDVIIPPQMDSSVSNLILQMNGLMLPRHGTFQFDFVVDGRQVATVPLYVRPPQQLRRAA